MASSIESALTAIAQKREKNMRGKPDMGESLDLLQLLNILHKHGLYEKGPEEIIRKFPGFALSEAEVQLLKGLPQIISAVKKQKGEKGDPGKDGVGRPGKDAVVNMPEIIERILRKIPMPRDGEAGKPGKDAVVDVDAIVLKVIAKLPKTKEGVKIASMDPTEIRKIVASMMTVLPQALDRSASPEFKTAKISVAEASHVVVTNANKELVTTDVTVQQLLDVIAGGGGGGGGATFSDKEVPAGAINDSNTAFVLDHTPIAGSEHIFYNGVLMTGGGVDYTISGDTITFAFAPVTGSRLLASYRY